MKSTNQGYVVMVSKGKKHEKKIIIIYSLHNNVSIIFRRTIE